MSAETQAWAAAVTATCAPIVAVVGYGLAGLMAWTDRGGVDV